MLTINKYSHDTISNFAQLNYKGSVIIIYGKLTEVSSGRSVLLNFVLCFSPQKIGTVDVLT